MAKKTEMVGFKTTPAVKEALLNIAKLEDRSISYIILSNLLRSLGDRNFYWHSEIKRIK